MNMRVWASGIAVVLALTGCGGDDPSESPTSDAAAAISTDEWVDVAVAECKAVNKTVEAAEPKGDDPFRPQATPKQQKQGVALLSTLGTALGDFAGNLEAAGYPQEKAADAKALVRAAKNSAKAFDKAAAAAKKDFKKAVPSVQAALGTMGALEGAAQKVGIASLENCKRGSDQAEKPAAGAEKVPVVATKKGTKYVFEFDTSLSAGKTAFVMTNKGKESHFMAIAEFSGPGAVKKAIAAEAKGDSKAADRFIVNEEVGGSEDAAPGKTAVANVNLKPGTYGMMCFIPGPDGKPHAFNGMAVEFEVK